MKKQRQKEAVERIRQAKRRLMKHYATQNDLFTKDLFTKEWRNTYVHYTTQNDLFTKEWWQSNPELLTHQLRKTMRVIAKIEEITAEVERQRVVWRSRPRKAPRIASAPGWGAYGALQRIFPKKIVTESLEPMFADFQREYLEALSKGKWAYARWLRTRFYLTLLLVAIPDAVLRILEPLLRLRQ
jgi:hypothetical protein